MLLATCESPQLLTTPFATAEAGQASWETCEASRPETTPAEGKNLYHFVPFRVDHVKKQLQVKIAQRRPPNRYLLISPPCLRTCRCTLHMAPRSHRTFSSLVKTVSAECITSTKSEGCRTSVDRREFCSRALLVCCSKGLGLTTCMCGAVIRLTSASSWKAEGHFGGLTVH